MKFIIEKPVFVIGCCNSGTTILWETLKNHIDLSGPDIEGQDIDDLPFKMKHYLGNATFRLWAHPKFKLAYYFTEDDYRKDEFFQVEKVFKRFLIPDTRLITKSPADTLRARLIQAYFPDAQFIGIVRNGFAVSEGIVRKRKFDPDRPQYKGLKTTIEEAAEQWSRANTILLSHQKHLKNYKIITYEDLVNNTEDTFKGLSKFLNIKEGGFNIPAFDKDRNEMQINRLTLNEVEVITEIAGPMLSHYNYKPPNAKSLLNIDRNKDSYPINKSIFSYSKIDQAN